MNWGRLKKRVMLFAFGQVFLLSGALLTAIEPIVGIVIALIGVVFHVELILDIFLPTDTDDSEVRAA